MTAETDLLPSSVAAFTEALKGERGSLDAWLEVNDEREASAHVEAYARACVSSATEALRAEVERLEIAGRLHSGVADLAINAARAAEARAERLAEALQEAREYVVSELAAERDKFAGYEHCSTIASIEADLAKIDAALEQETTNG